MLSKEFFHLGKFTKFVLHIIRHTYIMKHDNIYVYIRNLCCLAGFLLCTCGNVRADGSQEEHLQFNRLSIREGLPTDEVQQVYQDREGYIWIATRNGLAGYDGYVVKTLKSNYHTPGLLTGNNITCLAEDSRYNLWIGTRDGLNVMNKKTGVIRKFSADKLQNNTIAALLVTRDDEVWVGTDSGLHLYVAEADTFRVFTSANTDGVLPPDGGGIKSLLEDARGTIWVGTWAHGLFRYDKVGKQFVAYPPLNDRNSAHFLYEDRRGRLWVGSWFRGLHRIDNPYDLKNLRYKTFLHDSANPASISDDMVYSISEDPVSGTLWVGTRNGLSLLTEKNEEQGVFINYLPDGRRRSIPYNEVNSVLCDRAGIMWLGMMGGGVCMVSTRSSQFNLYRSTFASGEITTNSVRSLAVDDDGLIWSGIGTYGAMVYDRRTGKSVYYRDHPDWKDVERLPTVHCISKDKNSPALWFATDGAGIYIYDKTKKTERIRQLMPARNPWLCDSNIYVVHQDRRGYHWIGTWGGIRVNTRGEEGIALYPRDSTGKNIPAYVYWAIGEDRDGNIWLGTDRGGAIRVTGDVHHPELLQYRFYNMENGKLNINNIQCIHQDSRQRLWVGTEGGGLNRYDPETDCFVSVNEAYKLSGDAVYSIREDEKGRLWLGTNAGLVRLLFSAGGEDAAVRTYTVTDGLQDNLFIRHASFRTPAGEMFFGGHKGYNSFYPADLKNRPVTPPIILTDIKVFNRSYMSMQWDERKKITGHSPNFARRIVLPYDKNNFSIEYAALTYLNPSQNKYAYKLEGFDTDWQYTDATHRYAYYNNLMSGKYTFHLKAANENGIWQERAETLEVMILPPPWFTWWAYLIYCLMLAGILFLAFRVTRTRIRMKHALQLQSLEQSKTEEMNHAKLQFFTNITHEFLTPLTILSASLDELRQLSPRHAEYYSVMGLNITRLIRLFQQILEFRKAETGNLKLKVSQGDIASFLRTEVESFRPLLKKKKMYFSVVCDPENILAYFDRDKLDKIIYNLLSNAAKYNKSEGSISVTLSYGASTGEVVLTVKDNGPGISRQAQKNLFKRFYEGDYRRFNTIGTGIGLSLTKDLVDLHGGTIAVESEEGQGAAFIVTLPIVRSAYCEEQIDDTPVLADGPSALSEALPELPADDRPKSASLLLIEDNEELLELMVKLLSREYNVFTATNGREGVRFIESEDIDLVVSDIMMPEMDGIEFCRYVKENFNICHIPVILLTAKSKEEDRIEAYDSGADGFISKPFNLALLHAKIKNLLKAKERVAKDFKKQLVFEAKELNYTSMDEDFLQRAVDCVHKHLDDPEFDQMQFIDEMGTSKSTLYKKLKSLTGLNTSAFIRNIRLKAACRIIEEKKRVRISELAYAVGFNDPKYFSSCFKREFGMLPSEYQEQGTDIE